MYSYDVVFYKSSSFNKSWRQCTNWKIRKRRSREQDDYKWECTVCGSYWPPSAAACPSKRWPAKSSPSVLPLKSLTLILTWTPHFSTKTLNSLCRCEHMDGAVHEGDAGREGRDGTERALARLLPPDLQAFVPQVQARLRLRRGHPRPQAPHRHCPPPTAWQCAGQGPQDRREVASQSGMWAVWMNG